MIQSKDIYDLTTHLNKKAVEQALLKNTLIKSTLVVEKTDRLFIGKVEDSSFRIIEASPKGSACVVNGQLEQLDDQTNIHIQTSIHKTYLILLGGWFIVLTGVIVFFAIRQASSSSFIISFLWLVIGFIIFRAFLHWRYIRARNTVIEMIGKLVS